MAETATLTQTEPQTQLPPEFRSWPEYLWDEALRRAGAAGWRLSIDQEERFDREVDAIVFDQEHIATHNLLAAFECVIVSALAATGLQRSEAA